VHHSLINSTSVTRYKRNTILWISIAPGNYQNNVSPRSDIDMRRMPQPFDSSDIPGNHSSPTACAMYVRVHTGYRWHKKSRQSHCDWRPITSYMRPNLLRLDNIIHPFSSACSIINRQSEIRLPQYQHQSRMTRTVYDQSHQLGD